MHSISTADLVNLTVAPVSVVVPIEPQQQTVEPPTNSKIPLETKYKVLKRRNRYLESKDKKAAEKAEKNKHKDEPYQPNRDIKSALNDFLAVMRYHRLQFDTKTVLNTFIMNADTAEDARKVMSKAKTLSRARATIIQQKGKKRLDYYVDNYRNANRIFTCRESILDREDSLSIVFGQNILKRATGTMLFYHLPINLELARYTIERAHFDGKYTDCPRPYKQSVELRLVMSCGDKQITLTFARALLSGSSTEDYAEFFVAARNAKLKKVPLFITDFEIAVSTAILQVFPNVQVRGCWYHYWNNILCESSLLSRVTNQKIDKFIVIFLVMLPFLHHQEKYVSKLIAEMGFSSYLTHHRDVNFKLIMYVYSTYMQRFQHLFAIDLSLSLARTNNTCEGSNSGLSKQFSMRPTLREFTTYVENSFKKQYVMKPKKVPAPTALDKLLKAVQLCSLRNEDVLFETLICEMKKDKFKLRSIRVIRITEIHTQTSNDSRTDDEVRQKLNTLALKYKRTRTARRRMCKDLKNDMLKSHQVMRPDDKIMAEFDIFESEDEMTLHVNNKNAESVSVSDKEYSEYEQLDSDNEEKLTMKTNDSDRILRKRAELEASEGKQAIIGLHVQETAKSTRRSTKDHLKE